MKKPILFSLVIVMIYLFPGCSKNNDAESYLKGILDGQPFECKSNITANEREPMPGSGDDPNLRITGDWQSYSLKLMLLGEGTIKTGTYTFEPGKQRSATLLHNNTEEYYAGAEGIFSTGQLRGSGRITITEVSKKHVKGTFEFTAVGYLLQGNTKTVTNGEFSINRN